MTRSMPMFITTVLAGVLAIVAGVALGAPSEADRLKQMLDDANRQLAAGEAELARLERDHDRRDDRELRRRQMQLETDLQRERQALMTLENDLAWQQRIAPRDQWALQRAAETVSQRRRDVIESEAAVAVAVESVERIRAQAAALVGQPDVQAAAAEPARRAKLVDAQVDRVLDALEQQADYRLEVASEQELAQRIFATLRVDPLDTAGAAKAFGNWLVAANRVNFMRRDAVANDAQVLALRKDADAAAEAHQALAQRAAAQTPPTRELADAENQALAAESRRAVAVGALRDAEGDLWRIQDQAAARNADLAPLQLALFDHRCRAEAISRELDQLRHDARRNDPDDRRDQGRWQAARARRDQARAAVDDLNRRLRDAQNRDSADDRRRREEQARIDAQQRAQAERQAREEQARLESLRLKTAEEQRQEVRRQDQLRKEAAARDEESRKADEAKKAKDARRAALARRQQAEEAGKIKEQQERQSRADADAARKAQQARAADDARKMDDARKAEEDKRRQDEQARLEASRLRTAEEQRQIIIREQKLKKEAEEAQRRQREEEARKARTDPPRPAR